MFYPSYPSQVVGVAQAINKKSGEDGAFTEQDEKVSKVQCSAFKERVLLLFKNSDTLKKLVGKIHYAVLDASVGQIDWHALY